MAEDKLNVPEALHLLHKGLKERVGAWEKELVDLRKAETKELAKSDETEPGGSDPSMACAEKAVGKLPKSPKTKGLPPGERRADPASRGPRARVALPGSKPPAPKPPQADDGTKGRMAALELSEDCAGCGMPPKVCKCSMEKKELTKGLGGPPGFNAQGTSNPAVSKPNAFGAEHGGALPKAPATPSAPAGVDAISGASPNMKAEGSESKGKVLCAKCKQSFSSNDTHLVRNKNYCDSCVDKVMAIGGQDAGQDAKKAEPNTAFDHRKDPGKTPDDYDLKAIDENDDGSGGEVNEGKSKGVKPKLQKDQLAAPPKAPTAPKAAPVAKIKLATKPKPPVMGAGTPSPVAAKPQPNMKAEKGSAKFPPGTETKSKPGFSGVGRAALPIKTGGGASMLSPDAPAKVRSGSGKVLNNPFKKNALQPGHSVAISPIASSPLKPVNVRGDVGGGPARPLVATKPVQTMVERVASRVPAKPVAAPSIAGGRGGGDWGPFERRKVTLPGLEAHVGNLPKK